MDGVIRLENITYTYPLASEPALKNINLTLERGKFYALLGANGSGQKDGDFHCGFLYSLL